MTHQTSSFAFPSSTPCVNENNWLASLHHAGNFAAQQQQSTLHSLLQYLLQVHEDMYSPSLLESHEEPSLSAISESPGLVQAESKQTEAENGDHDQRGISCPFCHRFFSEKCNMIRHSRIHTGHKPFRCTVDGCPRRFTDSSNRRRHAQNHKKRLEKARRLSMSEVNDQLSRVQDTQRASTTQSQFPQYQRPRLY